MSSSHVGTTTVEAGRTGMTTGANNERCGVHPCCIGLSGLRLTLVTCVIHVGGTLAMLGAYLAVSLIASPADWATASHHGPAERSARSAESTVSGARTTRSVATLAKKSTEEGLAEAAGPLAYDTEYLGGPWRANHGRSLAEFSSLHRTNAADGYWLIDVAVASERGYPFFSALWQRRRTPPYWYFSSMSDFRLARNVNELRVRGHRPAHVDVYADGRNRRYFGVWQEWIGAPYVVDARTTISEWPEFYREAVDSGYRPLRIDVSQISVGAHTVLSLWEQRETPSFRVRFGIDEAHLQTETVTNAEDGYRPVRISGYDEGGEARLIVIFERRPSTPVEAVAGLNAAAYQADSERRVASGMRLSSVAAYRVGETIRYGGVWEQARLPVPSPIYPKSGVDRPELQTVEDAMTSFMRARKITAGALCIARNGVVVYERSFGWKDFMLHEPLAKTAMFRLASLSKPITAAAIRALATQERLSLSDSVFDLGQPDGGLLGIIPWGSPDHRLKDVTVQHLLKHRGGWDRAISGDPTFRPLRIATDLNVAMPPTREDIARWVSGRPLDHSPGTTRSYSNYGFMLLGLVIEAVTGQDATDWVRDTILVPSGVVGRDFELGRTLPESRSEREPWYLDPTNSGTFNVLRPSELAQWPNGGWRQEDRKTQGGWMTTTRAYVRFLMNYWLDGTPRSGHGRDFRFYGSLSGTRTVARQRPDGVSYVAFFNQRADSSGLEYYPDRDLDKAIDSVSTWPVDGVLP